MCNAIKRDDLNFQLLVFCYQTPHFHTIRRQRVVTISSDALKEMSCGGENVNFLCEHTDFYLFLFSRASKFFVTNIHICKQET